MKVAIYGRVSTAEQSAAMQLGEMRDFCSRREWEIVEEFTDTMTGSKEIAPGPNRLLADARRRKFDVVLVYRYDRFARSLRQLVNALGEFDALGIHFVSLHEGVDTSTPLATSANVGVYLSLRARFSASILLSWLEVRFIIAILTPRSLKKPREEGMARARLRDRRLLADEQLVVLAFHCTPGVAITSSSFVSAPVVDFGTRGQGAIASRFALWAAIKSLTLLGSRARAPSIPSITALSNLIS